MPLRKTEKGSECPLGHFEVIKGRAGSGMYTNDAIETCLFCEFGDVGKKNLDDICQCQPDMTKEEYARLKKGYASTPGKHTSAGFLEYVKTSRVQAKG